MFLGATRYHSIKKFIKTSILVVGVLLVVALPTGKDQILAAQGINKQINYQGKLLTSAGIPVTSGTYSIRFSLYDALSGGNRIWTASGSVGSPGAINVDVSENGLFSILLGSGAQNTLDGVNWNDDAIYLGVTVGSDSEMTPRKRFGSVAQAFNAESWNGYRTASSVVSGAEVLKLVQTGENAASSDRSTLLLSTSGTSDTYDYLIKAMSSSGAVFTVSRQGNVTTTGNFAVSGQTIIGDATSDTLTVNARVASSLIVATNNAFDLGSSALSWRDIYASGTIRGVDASLSGALTIGGLSSLQTLTFTSGTGTDLYAGMGRFGTVCLSGDCRSAWPSGGSFDWANLEFPPTNNVYSLGSATGSLANIYASGTAYIEDDVVVGGQSVCLANGTNCPGAAVSSLQQVIASSPYATSTPFFYGGLSASNITATGTVYASSTVTDNLAATTTNLTVGGNGRIYSGSDPTTYLELSGPTINSYISGVSMMQVNPGGTLFYETDGSSKLQMTNGLGFFFNDPDGTARMSVLNNGFVFYEADGTTRFQMNDDGATTLFDSNGSTRFSLNAGSPTVLYSNTGTPKVDVNDTDFTFYDDLLPVVSDVYDIGTSTQSWKNIYASGTAYIGTNVIVNGSSVCLANGTNCPVLTPGTDTLLSVTNRGSIATSTSIYFYGGATTSRLNVTGTSALADVSFTSGTGSSLSLTGELSAGSSTVTTLNFTNATGSDLYALVIRSLAASITNVSSTDLSVSNGFTANSSTLTTLNFTNATGTDLYAGTIRGESVVFTNIVSTHATSTNLYISNLLNANTVTSTNLYANSGIIGSLIASSSTLQNVSSTNLTFVTASGSSFTANTATIGTLVAGNISSASATFTNVSSTNLSVSNGFTAASGSVTFLNFTSATGSDLFATTGRFTTVTSTNFFANSATVGQFTSHFITSASSTITALNFTSATGTDIFSTMGRFGTVTSTDVIANIGTFATLTVGGQSVCLANGTNCVAEADTLLSVTNRGGIATSTSIYFYGGATTSQLTATGTIFALGDIQNTFVSTTAAFTQVATMPNVIGGLSDIAIYGSFAYIIDTDGGTNAGLLIYDVSNPESPQFVTSTRLASHLAGIAVSGDYAYVYNSQTGAVMSIDVSNPLLPTVADTVSIGQTGLNTVTFIVDGHFLYGNVSPGARIFIVDIADPANLILASDLLHGNVMEDFAVRGKYIYSIQHAGGDIVIDDRTDPYNLINVSSTPDTAAEYWQMEIQGNYLYAAAGEGNTTLSIFDISDALNPTLVAQTGTSTNRVGGLVVSGRYAYTGGNTTPLIYDISDPLNPVLVQAGPIMNPKGAISGRYFYGLDDWGGVYVYKINGIETAALQAHSLETGLLMVSGNAFIDDHLFVSNGLNVGAGGIMTNGSIAVMATTTPSIFMGGVSSTAIVVNGQNVCLANGVNCPATTESDTLLSVTNRGGIATSTSIYFYGGATTSRLNVTGTSALADVSFTSATGSSVSLTGGISAGSAVITNVSSTDLSVSNGFTAASGSVTFLNFTSATGSDLFATTGRFTTVTSTNLFANSATVGQFTSNFITSASSTITALNFTNATGTDIFAITGRFTTVTSTNLFANIGSFATLTVGGQSVCLANGTNCVAEADTLLTVTNRGGIATSTSIYFYGGATTSRLNVTGTSALADVSFTSGTGSSLSLTGELSAGSSTVTTLNFTNATGSDLFVTSGRFATATTNGIVSYGATGTLSIVATTTEITGRLDAYGLNRWFQSPLLSYSLGGNRATTTVGTNPSGISFDGTHVWSSNLTDGTVSKIDVRTGAIAATVTVGTSPDLGSVYDGRYVWIANNGSDNLSKIDPRTNTVATTVVVGDGPQGMVFDGSSIWVANSTAETVSRVSVTSSQVIATIAGTGSVLDGAFDGTYVWFASNAGAVKIDPGTDSIVTTVTVGSAPFGAAFDGSYVWISNGGADTLSKIDPRTNAVIATVAVGDEPHQIAFDGEYLWISNFGNDDTVSKVDPRTNAVVATLSAGTDPSGIAFDGTYVWVNNFGSNNVTRFAGKGNGHGAAFAMQDATFRNATGTNLDISGALRVNGSSVCLQSGTNCPATTESDTLLTVTNRGGIATSTSIYFYGGATTSRLNVTGTSALADVSFTSGTGSSLSLTGELSAGSSTVTTLNFTNATGSDLFATTGRFGTVTSTNLYANIGSFASLTVGGQSVCLENGTDCPASIESDTLLTVTNRGGIATSTSIYFYGGATTSRLNVTGTSALADVSFTSGTGSSLSLTGELSAGSSTVTTLNFTNATGSDLFVARGRMTDLAVTNATGTSLDISGTAHLATIITEGISVNGQSVCLENGLNCPASGSTESWTYDVTTNMVRMATTTNSFGLGGTTEANMPFYFRVQATSSRLLLGAGASSTDVVIGAGTSTITNEAFQLNGNDLFVAGDIGAASSFYTNGSFIAGTTTSYGANVIRSMDATGTLSIITTSTLFTGRVDADHLSRWFQAPQTAWSIARGATQFTIGGSPESMTFDGAYVWVARYGDSVVSKIDPITNVVAASVAVGANPTGMAFDGRNVWVSNFGSGTVSKIDAATAKVVASTTVGGSPREVAFDGVSIWVANNGDDTVTKITATSGVVTATVTVGDAPIGVAFDGASIWVANNGADTVSKVNISTNAVDATVNVGDQPHGVAFDGRYIWVMNRNVDTVSKIDPATDTVIATVSVGDQPYLAAFDGDYLWVTNAGNSTVSIIDVNTNAVADIRATPYTPFGITFDGSSMWVAGNDGDIGKFPANGGSYGSEYRIGTNLSVTGTSALQSVTFVNATGTNLDISGALRVGGSSVCLSSGTNCPPAAESDTLATVTNRGGVATSTSIYFYGGATTSRLSVTGTMEFVNATGSDLFVTMGRFATATTNGITSYGATGTISIVATTTDVTGRLDAYGLNRWFMDPKTALSILSVTGTAGLRDQGNHPAVAVGTQPRDVAFDGVHLWVANSGDGTVSKIDPRTNAVVATTAVGAGARAVVFDGTYLWVANSTVNSVNKIDIRTNTIVASTTVGGNPSGIGFDGSYIWVGNFNDDTVSKIDPRTNTVVATISTNYGPYDFAFDGGYVWVSNNGDNTVQKIDPRTNTVVATIGVAAFPTGIAFDGTYLWVGGQTADALSKIDVETNAVVATTTGITDPRDLAFDGTYLWVANETTDVLSKIDVRTNSVAATTTVGDGPYAIAFDGAYVWVVSLGQGLVSKVPATGGAYASNFLINSQLVCLADGTNCPAATVVESDTLATVTNRGGVATSTSIYFYGGATTSRLSVTGTMEFVNATGSDLFATTGRFTNGVFSTVTSTYVSSSILIANSATLGALTVAGQTVCLGNSVGCPAGVGVPSLQQVLDVGAYATSTNIYLFGGATTSRLTVTSTLSAEGDIENMMASGTPLELVGSLSVGVNAHHAVVQNDIAYILGYNSFITADVSDPRYPKILDTQAVALEDAQDVVVSGRYAYAASNNSPSRLAIFDISDPSNVLQIATSTALSNGTGGIAISGHYAYIMHSGSINVSIVDIADPYHPVVLPTVLAPGAESGIAVEDDALYLSSWSTGVVDRYSIANPEIPVAQGSLTSSANVVDLDVKDDYVYTIRDTSKIFSIIDYSDPSSPVLLATTTLGVNPKSVVVSGRYAFVMHQGSDATEAPSVMVFDIASSTNPINLGRTLVGSQRYGSHLTVHGGYVYVTNAYDQTLYVLRVPAGTETSRLIAHTAELGSLVVRGTADVSRDLFVGSTIFAGHGGIISNGAISVSATSTVSVFMGGVSSTSLTVNGMSVCLEDGTDCPAASGGFAWSALEFPPTNNTYALGSATGSLANIYASGTVYVGTNVVVNGQSVCLQDGTNCPNQSSGPGSSFYAYDEAGAISISQNVWTDIRLDTNGPTGAAFSHTAGTSTISINIAGTYRVTYYTTFETPTAAIGTSTARLAESVGGGAFTEIPASRGKSTGDNRMQDGSSVSLTILRTFAAGTLVKLQARKDNNIAQQTMPNSTGVVIETAEENSNVVINSNGSGGQLFVGTSTQVSTNLGMNGSWGTYSTVIASTTNSAGITKGGLFVYTSSTNSTSTFIYNAAPNGKAVLDVRGGCATGTNDLAVFGRTDDWRVASIACSGQIKSDYGITVTQGADYAEYFPSREAAVIRQGDVIALDAMAATSVVRGTIERRDATVGVISKHSAYIGNAILADNPNAVLVGMLGQLDTKVDTRETGIAIGDKLMMGADGYAVKAKGPGMILGTAMEALAQGTTGTVMAYVSPVWWAGDLFSLDENGSVLIQDFIAASTTKADANVILVDSPLFSFRGTAYDASTGAVIESSFSLHTIVHATSSSSFVLSSSSVTSSPLLTVTELGDVALIGKLYPSAYGAMQHVAGIFYDNTTSTLGERMRADGAGWGAEASGYAETYNSDDALIGGDVVVADLMGVDRVKRSSTAYEDGVIGVVSDRPGFLAGNHDAGRFAVVVSGKAYVNVNTENGTIKTGDALVASSESGTAMRGTNAGPMIGLALESFDGTSASTTVLVQVRPGWFSGIVAAESLVPASGASSESTLATQGIARIFAGEKSVKVSFASIGTYPLISVTPYNAVGNWWISGASDVGFTISVSETSDSDITFAWSVSMMPQGTTVWNSDGSAGTVNTLTGQTVFEPVAQEEPAGAPPAESPPTEDPPPVTESPPVEESPPAAEPPPVVEESPPVTETVVVEVTPTESPPAESPPPVTESPPAE